MNRFLSFIVGLIGLFLIIPDMSAQNGYEIKAPDGKVTCFVYDKNNDSWSQMENGKLVEIFRFNDNGTIQVNLGDKKMDVTVDEMGLNDVATATGRGFFYAAR